MLCGCTYISCPASVNAIGTLLGVPYILVWHILLVFGNLLRMDESHHKRDKSHLKRKSKHVMQLPLYKPIHLWH